VERLADPGPAPPRLGAGGPPAAAAAAARGPAGPPVPPGLRVERVLADGRLRLWVGYEADRPVGVGSLFVAEGVAAFSLGVTLPEARRRGYWAAMAAVRLVEEPGLPAVGIFSDMSRPSAEAIGFLPLARFTLWHRPRPGSFGAARTS
jgi:hypothetical protein